MPATATSEPTQSPTPNPTQTPSPAPTSTPTNTPLPTSTLTPVPTNTPVRTPTPAPTDTPTQTPQPTAGTSDDEFSGGPILRIKTSDSFGSGFFFDPDGWILTNAHLVEGYEQVDVIIGDSTTLVATVVGVHEPADLAVLKVSRAQKFYWSEFARPGLADASLRDEVGSYGYGTTDSSVIGLTVIGASVISKTTIDGVDYLELDVAIDPGHTGGPLFLNDEGVIGVNTLVESGDDETSLAISIDFVRSIVEDLKKGASTLSTKPKAVDLSELATYEPLNGKWTINYPEAWFVGDLEIDPKGGFYTIESVDFISSNAEPFMQLIVLRFVKQAQVFSSVKDWHENRRRLVTRQEYLNYDIESEETIREDTRGILLKATIQPRADVFLHMLMFNVVSKRDNFMVQLLASQEAWETRGDQLRELVLSFRLN
ncbi:MAG: trypsin-like peptidase domain-containing protein [Chloroflexi bacterium]|nr:trypsin-like peptidase domain-containing protein [Chloroflexota bacterium]